MQRGPSSAMRQLRPDDNASFCQVELELVDFVRAKEQYEMDTAEKIDAQAKDSWHAKRDSALAPAPRDCRAWFLASADTMLAARCLPELRGHA